MSTIPIGRQAGDNSPTKALLKEPLMSVPTTMFRLSGRDYPPAKLGNASLIIIDAQKEYLSGPLQLSGMDEAVANIARLLDAARKAGRPIIHVRHLGTVGGLFDPQGPRGEFIEGLEPRGDEIVIEKRMRLGGGAQLPRSRSAQRQSRRSGSGQRVADEVAAVHPQVPVATGH
jgi:nicotinamidase-related amidase